MVMRCRFREAQSEASHAASVFEKLGATLDLESCQKILQDGEGVINNPTA